MLPKLIFRKNGICRAICYKIVSMLDNIMIIYADEVMVRKSVEEEQVWTGDRRTCPWQGLSRS